jgi:dTDP-4-dehydrorhamnose reductase
VAERRILLTGASGLLGSAVLPELRPLGDVEAPDLEKFDLDRPETVHRFIDGFRPTHIVHLGADARVDHCEEHPEAAVRTNVNGTVHVADAARKIGARVLLMSTDYVFDGAQRTKYREYQSTRPLNAYGRTKEEAERAVLALAGDRVVVRSSSLYGAGGANFVASILDRAQRGESLEVVDDQTQGPTWVRHLAPALARIAVSEIQGILHVAGAGECTWFAFAVAILEGSGLRVSCKPIPSEQSRRPARRPAYSVLDCTLAADALGIVLPDWRVGLKRHMEETGAWRN